MQYTLRVKPADEDRIQGIAARFKITRTELIRRLFLVGVAQVERGVDLFNPETSSRLETLLTAIQDDLERVRARDFHLASDALENRIRLRTLGDLLAPTSTELVKERVGKVMPRFLASIEELPPFAPPAKRS
jgi:hypothetical protein